MLYWLLHNEPLTAAKKRDVVNGVKQDARYLYLEKQLKKLTAVGEVKRNKGLREITYATKSIKQNHHWLDRAWLRMTFEFFCRQHPEFTYEWENEQGMRKKPGIADCTVYLARQREKGIEHRWYRVEIDRGNKELWEVRDQLRAHIGVFRAYRDQYRGTPEYRPWRILFSTNNRKNFLSRIRRYMASVEEAEGLPEFIVYTDKERYSPAEPERLVYEPIWQTAFSEEMIPLIRR
jgi:hypothetical protein